jgi:hypothetical protein
LHLAHQNLRLFECCDLNFDAGTFGDSVRKDLRLGELDARCFSKQFAAGESTETRPCTGNPNGVHGGDFASIF